MARETQIRRRRTLLQLTMAVIAVGVIAIPLSACSGRRPLLVVRPSTRPVSIWCRGATWGTRVLNITNAQYPVALGCGSGFPSGFPVAVQQVTYVRPPGATETLALVLVHCASGTPTPSSFYAFAPGKRRRPNRASSRCCWRLPFPGPTFLWYAGHFRVSGATVTMAARGVGANSAICCPNVSTTMRWTFEGHRFVRIAEPIRTKSGR